MKTYKQIKEEITNVTTTVGPGMGDNPTNEVFPNKTKKNKPVWPMFRRLPLKLTQEEIANVTGAAVSTDQPVVNRNAQEKWKKANKKKR